MYAEYFFTFVKVGQVYVYLTVETSGTKQCLVKYVHTVGSGKDNHTTVGAEAVHFSQQLIQGVFTLIISTHCRVFATSTAYRVNFVDKDNTRSFFFSLLEQVTYAGSINGTMPVMNDEVPDEGDFDANRHRGEFDDITPEDFIRGMGNPPGWLSSDEINRMRREIPIPYVVVVPVRTDDLGRVAQIGSLLRVTDDGGIERTLIAGRVLYHESLREAVARNVAKDLGDIALPQLPISLQPFTVAEFFPTPGLSDYYDPRQHAIALCYVVPIAGDCKPQDETLDVEWVDPFGDMLDTFVGQMANGYGTIVRQALAWTGK